MSNESNQPAYKPPKTMLVPCRSLPTGAGFQWLREGWIDFWNAGGISLVYGFFVFLVSVLVAWLAWKLGGFVLLLSALSGFVFVAPMLAFGLYSVSITPTFYVPFMYLIMSIFAFTALPIRNT